MTQACDRFRTAFQTQRTIDDEKTTVSAKKGSKFKKSVCNLLYFISKLLVFV